MTPLTIRQQILIMPLLSAVAVCLVAVFAAGIVSEKIESSHRLQIQSVTETAVRVVGSLEAQVRAGRLDEAQAKILARDAMRAIRFAGNEYFYVYDYDGVLLAHPIKTDLEGTDKLKNTVDANGLHTIPALIQAARSGGGFVPFLWPKPGDQQPSAKLGYAGGFDPWGWMIGTGVYVDDVAAESRRALVKIGLVGLIALGAVGGVGLLIARGIGRRVDGQSRRMLALAEGDLDTPIAAGTGRDELSAMARALEVFRQRMIEGQANGAAREAEQAHRSEQAQAIAVRARAFDQVASTAIDVVADAAGALERNATEMSQAAEVTSNRSVTVASAAEQASVNVQTVAAATEEMSASISEISRQVTTSARIALDAVSEAGRTSAHVRGLAEAALRIGAVVNLINDIAAQTNLLALNATIEAARAGEAGKGFAVVAGEVKHLANQTAKATEEISDQVTAIQQATEVAVQAIDSISGVIGTIRDSTQAIAAAVEQQGATTQEITRNVHQAASGTSLVSHTITEVTQAVEQTRHASGDVLAAAGRLRSECTELRGQVRRFIDDLPS
jgi:methyl-accepting chemotaxis protein